MLLNDGVDDKGFENTETCVTEMQLILLHCATAIVGNVDNDNKSGLKATKSILAIEFSQRRNFAGD